MFNQIPTATQIIKTDNGWLVITPSKNRLSPVIPGYGPVAFDDPEFINQLKDLNRELNSDPDDVMEKIRRDQAQADKPSLKAPQLLKDMPQNNMHVFKTIDEVCAFLKIRSGE